MQEDKHQDAPQETEAEQLEPNLLASWTASEYVAHQRGASWYALLALAVVVLAAIVLFWTQDVVSTIVVIISGISLGVFAMRKPQVRTYELYSTGLQISEKHYPYSDFKSFALHEEEALRSIFMLPIKRFMPGFTIYYPPEQEETIVTILAQYLPLDDREPDPIQRLSSKFRL